MARLKTDQNDVDPGVVRLFLSHAETPEQIPALHYPSEFAN